MTDQELVAKGKGLLENAHFTRVGVNFGYPLVWSVPGKTTEERKSNYEAASAFLETVGSKNSDYEFSWGDSKPLLNIRDSFHQKLRKMPSQTVDAAPSR